MDGFSDHIDWRGRLLAGIVTMKPVPWKLEENFRRLEQYVREAARRRAGVVVAPECVLDGYVACAPGSTKRRMLKVAQTVPDGPYIVHARELCRELGVFLVFGFLERVDERMFNTCCLIDPDGQVIAKYSKVHPYAEPFVTAGCQLEPFDTPLGRVGFLICSDRGFGHNFDALGAQNVDIIFLPTNGGNNGTETISVRAQDNRCFVIAANAWGCAVVEPTGTVRVDKCECECVTVVQINLLAINRGGDRTHLTCGRRTDLYGPLTVPTERRFDEHGEPTARERRRRAELRKEVKTLRDRLRWDRGPSR